MHEAIITIYVKITSFVLIGQLEKDHSMIETHHLKDVVIFFQAILSFVLSRKMSHLYFNEESDYSEKITYENQVLLHHSPP